MRLQKQLTNQKEYTKIIYNFITNDINSFYIYFNYNYNYWLPLYWLGCKQTTYYTYLINFSDYVLEDEFKRFSKGHKWIINKVERNPDLRVESTLDVEEYLVESDKTYQRQNVQKPYDNNIVRKLHKELSKRGMSTILKILDKENNVHAIAYYIHNQKEVYYWLGASDEKLRESGGHTYLTWYAIKHFSSRVEVFNFGGSMIEHVERNFRNFSATPTQYFVISKSNRNLPFLLRYTSTILKKII